MIIEIIEPQYTLQTKQSEKTKQINDSVNEKGENKFAIF
jgi:hypothetical protein